MFSFKSKMPLIYLSSVHPTGSDFEVLRLHQIRPMCDRLPGEGLPCDRERRQQRAQLPREAAQRADEGGQLQGDAHEMLEGHIIGECPPFSHPVALLSVPATLLDSLFVSMFTVL